MKYRRLPDGSQSLGRGPLVAYAGPGQVQDAGAKMIHCAPETTSTIISKSISKTRQTTYRGLVKVEEGATGAKSFVRCDALILDEQSVSETKPTWRSVSKTRRSSRGDGVENR